MKKLTNDRHPMTSPRGSALILVVLLTLILAATSIVALRDVARSTRGSAVYRTRAQAQLTSDAASRTYADWLGRYAGTIMKGLKNSERGEETDGNGDSWVNVFGGRADGGIDIDDSGGDPTFDERKRSLAVRGPVVVFTDDQLGECASCTPLLVNSGASAGDDETGLFRTDDTETTFESRRTSEFRVVTRDIVDGPPAPWYGDGTCFKKALIAADARVGQVDPDWSKANNVAAARHGIEAFIGPVEGCN
jgi:hypothetical protein